MISADKMFYTKNDFIHLAFTLTNILGEKKKIHDNITVEFQMWDKKSKLMVQFERMLQSIFLSSVRTPLHFIIITDRQR